MSKAPRWDLSSLYSSQKDPAIQKDLAMANVQIERLSARGKGKIEKMPAQDFATMLVDYEKIITKIEKVDAYSNLSYGVDMNTPETVAFYEKTSDKVQELFSKTDFFTTEIENLSEEKMADLMKNPVVQKYSEWLKNLRSENGTPLDSKTEEYISEMRKQKLSPAVDLHEKETNTLPFVLDGKPALFSDLYSMAFSHDPEIRAKAGLAMNEGYGTKAETFASILSTVAEVQQEEDKLRGFKTPVEFRNKSNNIEDDVVDALVSSVENASEKVPHRYYALKAKWLGKDKISYWERNAPVEEIKPRKYSFEEAKDIVISAYKAFDPEIGGIVQGFFDEKRIDAEARAGKSGAEMAQLIAGEKPFVRLDFQGTTNDVLVLAHEIGHGVHYTLAEKQGRLGAVAPITVNETASIFGEMLAFDYMIKNEKDPMQRFALTADKMNRTMITTFRQISIHRFEEGVHNGVREQGPLKPDEISKVWNEAQKSTLGPSVVNDETTKHAWMAVPHCVESPFYVYGYAFGECLTSSLYQVYEKGEVKDFAQKYKEMLSKGGTENYSKLLKPFGLDASKPDFWKQGLTKMEKVIDNLEVLTDRLGLDKTKKQALSPVALKQMQNKTR